MTGQGTLHTGLPEFDRARWQAQPDVRDIVSLGEVGVLRQTFAPSIATFEVAVTAPETHVLLWVLGHAQGRFETRIDGRADSGAPDRLRNAYILPAGMDSLWRGPGGPQHECLHFHFTPCWLRHLAEEHELGATAAELAPRAGLRDPSLAALVTGLVAATTGGGPASAAFVEHWAVLAALRLLGQPRVPRRLAMAPWRLARVLALIEARLCEDISVTDLAAAAGLSRYHFTRAFRAETGLGPHAYLMQRRCERAKQLMLAGGEPLAGIALACGFAHQAHFTTAFRRAVGTTPGRWLADKTN